MTVTAHMRPLAERDYGQDVIEPKAWPNDRGAKRVAVTDPNWNDRIIRRVGWRTCMHCGKWMFSRDVIRCRLHEECRRIDCDLY